MGALGQAGFLELPDQRLEYSLVGPLPSEGPTLVLLHEGLGSVDLWHDFPDRLADRTGTAVFVYSRAGYGKSSTAPLPRPLSYMHDEAFKTLPRVLEAIGFRRGLLIGHSDGASIAALYAGGVQDHRVRGLSLIAPHFIVEDVTIASIAEARKAYEAGDLRQRLAKWHENVDVAFRGWNNAWLDPDFRDWDITESLAYIRVPVQIVQGSRDKYGTMKQVAVAQEECYCPVEVTIIDAAHAPHREAPDETLEAIADFVLRILKDHGEGHLENAA